MTSGAKRALTHSSIYAIGNISRQLAGFIMLPIYTRHLSPADYGVVGLLLALMALVEVFFGARLAQAVPKFYFDENDSLRKNSVISTALLVTGMASLITMIALILFKDISSKLLFNSINYSDAVGLFSVLILTQAIEFYAMTFIRIQQRPWLFISISLTKLILQLSLNIWLVVYEQMGVTGVAIGSAASSSAFALGLTIYTFRQTGLVFNKEQAIRMLKFSWPLWLGGLAGLYIGSANRYFINLFSSTSEVGLFELATKFSSILSVLIWEPFQQYWSTERFKIYHQATATTTYQTTFHGISALLAIGALGIGLFAPPLIHLMAAPTFYEAARAVPLLTLGTLFGCLTTFCSFSFLINEKTLWLTRNNYLTAAIQTIMFFALIPIWGFVGAAMAGAISLAAQFFITHFAGRRIYDMHIPLSSLFKYLGVLAIALGISYSLSSQSIIALLFINSAIFIIGTIAIAMQLIRHDGLRSQIINILPQTISVRFFSIRQ